MQVVSPISGSATADGEDITEERDVPIDVGGSEVSWRGRESRLAQKARVAAKERKIEESKPMLHVGGDDMVTEWIMQLTASAACCGKRQREAQAAEQKDAEQIRGCRAGCEGTCCKGPGLRIRAAEGASSSRQKGTQAEVINSLGGGPLRVWSSGRSSGSTRGGAACRR